MKINSNVLKFYIAFSLLYILPLLLANVYYADDITRSFFGSVWDRDGRYIATFLFQILSSGRKLVDFFPYTIILSSVIMVFAGYIVSQIIGIEKNKKIKYSALLLLTSPFMLENISYRWDSLPMSISILSVTLPFLFLNSINKFAIASIIGISLSLFLYQASLPIYLLLILSGLISSGINNNLRSSSNIIKASILSLIVALLIYKIATYFLKVNYTDNKNLTIFSTNNPLLYLINNIQECLVFIKMYVCTSILKLIFIVLSIPLFVSIIVLFKSSIHRVNKMLVIILLLLTPFVVFSIVIFQKTPYLISRMMLGFPFIIYAVLIFVNYVSEKLCSYLSIFIVLLSFPLMAVYANSLKSQDDFDKYLVQDISNRINLNSKNVIFNGDAPKAPELNVATKNYPILNILVPFVLKSKYWSFVFFQKHTKFLYSPNFLIDEKDCEILLNKLELLPIIDETRYYFLRANDSEVIIDFKSE